MNGPLEVSSREIVYNGEGNVGIAGARVQIENPESTQSRVFNTANHKLLKRRHCKQTLKSTRK